jgi:hypothetical protein
MPARTNKKGMIRKGCSFLFLAFVRCSYFSKKLDPFCKIFGGYFLYLDVELNRWSGNWTFVVILGC